MAKLDFKEESSSPSTPPAGYVRFYAKTDKYLYYKDDTGVETPVIPLSAEQVQDAIGNILTDTASIDFNYDDVGNLISASAIPGGINHDALSGFVANEHIDHSLVSVTSGEGLTGGGAITGNVTISAKIGYAQYSPSANFSNATTAYSKVNIQTDNGSYLNGYFTKSSATDITCNFTGRVFISFNALAYTDTNDRGYDITIRHNSTDLTYAVSRGWGKNVIERSTSVSNSVYLSVAQNDTISLTLRAVEAGVTVTIPAGYAILNVGIIS